MIENKKEDFMKRNNFFVIAGKFCVVLLFLSSLNCSKPDNDDPTIPLTPTPPLPTCNNCELLYYGQNQADAPSLDAGVYEAAARFIPSKIGNLAGKTIKEIHYFIVEKPDSIKLKLYGPSNDSIPGALLYSADVTDSALSHRWNVHKLTQAITLKNEDMWLSVGFKLTSYRKTIACDPGPALPEGNWLYNAMDSKWITYLKRTGTSINWNIRLNVAL